MSSTFDELNFAVFSQSNLTSSELVSLLNVASHFVYPLSYKFIVFYFAGHGGVDNGQAYVLPLQLQETKDPEKVYIEESIVSQFSSEKSPSLQYRFRILLFDCCLTTPSTRNDPSIKSEKFSLEARGGCLVAYATSRSYKSEGDMKRGGLWTHHLHQNLKLPLPISIILDRTHDAVKMESIASGRVQEPNYHSCIGEVYLKGTVIVMVWLEPHLFEECVYSYRPPYYRYKCIYIHHPQHNIIKISGVNLCMKCDEFYASLVIIIHKWDELQLALSLIHLQMLYI